MIQTSEQINEIATALAKAQTEIANVEKDATNPAFKREGAVSHYTTLGAALDEVRPKLSKHGISVIQMPINGEGSNIGVATRLAHSSGQWIESTLYVAPTQFTAQGAGSVITYLRRYALMAMTGIAPEDDDGNAATVTAPQAPRAGMVRAADVPPQKSASQMTGEEIAARRNGNNGIAGKPVEHPKRQEALDAYAHLNKRIKEAKTPAAIEELIKLNANDLAIIREVHAETYNQLMVMANGRKSEMYGETG